LQLANPEYDLVVCEAGCEGARGSSADMKKKGSRALDARNEPAAPEAWQAPSSAEQLGRLGLKQKSRKARAPRRGEIEGQGRHFRFAAQGRLDPGR
jgi:uncharacterized caspase-like protein